MVHEAGAYREMPPLPEGRIVRLCPEHRVELGERNNLPYCAWRVGHYPAGWIVVDRDKPGQETLAGDNEGAISEVQRMRAALARPDPPRAAAAPAKPKPPARPSVAVQVLPAAGALEPADQAVAEDKDEGRAAAASRQQYRRALAARPEERNMSVMRCSRCGGNGHNRRTCENEPRAGAAATPKLARKSGGGGGKKRRARRAAPAAPSTAIALASGRSQLAARVLVSQGSELEKVREKVATDLRELGRALLTFELIEILRRV